MDDPSRLEAALEGFERDLLRRRWATKRLYRLNSDLIFLHARKRRAGGPDEVIVCAKSGPHGGVMLRRYVLLGTEDHWLRCDSAALAGYLEEGPQGLRRGVARRKSAMCNCRRTPYVSVSRALKFARELALRYGKTGVQRPYRCRENIRVFHLTAQQQGSRALIPDAYIDPGEEPKNP